jgi:beta-barrel assembly-enhancing protease
MWSFGRTTGSATGVLLAASALAPAIAEGVYEPVELKDKERALIETAAELRGYFEQRSVLYREPRLEALLGEIGRELAPPPTDHYIEYRFSVLRDPSPNAFALPNGDIYVHTGMLARLADDAQLAALLAHEINHVAGHHSILEQRSSTKKTIAGLVISGTLGGAGSLISAGLYTSMYGYSRELEQEADDRAVLLLTDSRFDMHALPEIYEILAQDYEGLQPRTPTVYSTHPQLEARAARTREQVASAPIGKRDSAAFDAIVMPVRTMTIRDYIQDDYPYTAVALASDLAARYPQEPQFALLLGDAWQAMGARGEIDHEELSNRERRRNAAQRVYRTRQEREQVRLDTPEGQAAREHNLGRAREGYLRAIDLDAEFAPAYRGLGDVEQARGDERAAARAYLEYLRKAPDAGDRVTIVERLRVLRDQLQAEE